MVIFSITLGLPSVGEAITLRGLVPNVFAKPVNNEKNIYALPTTKHFFVVPEKTSFSLRRKIYIFANEPICIYALR